MWAFGVVESTPLFAKDLGFFQGIEDLTIEKLSTHTAVEGLNVSILPWTSRRDEGCLDVQFIEPTDKVLGDKLWSIVTADVGWRTVLDE